MNIDYSKFTHKSRNAIVTAVSLTKQCQYAAVEPQVMMVALLQEGNDMVSFMLNQMQVDKNAFCAAIGESIQGLQRAQVIDPDFSPSLVDVLKESLVLARRDRSNVVALEYIFWAFSKVDNPIKEIMSRFGVTPANVEEAVNMFRSGDEQEDQQTNGEDDDLPNLHRYGVNLIRLAEEGAIEPVIGRDEEIRRILQIISRKTKNNPILVGEPGTGKTAIVEGLAHRIIRGDIPQELRGLKLFSLNISSLIAGAQMQGEFEQRLKMVVQEVESDPNILLFIDEIHLIIGAGKSSGAMDAANILKPELARGVLKIIGATTLDEYREYIEQDKAFERRFQKVHVEEPDVESAIAIMRGIKSRFENHHQIKILDEAIVASVNLSHRYIGERFLPDKAIDLLDEAASSMRIDRSSSPHDLEMLKRQIRNKEIERESLIQDGASVSSAVIVGLDSEIADLREREHVLNAKWQNERRQLEEIQDLTSELQRLEINREVAEQQNRYSEVVEISRREEAIRSQIARLTDEIDSDDECLLKSALDEKDIMKVVTAWTGIPMTNMTRDENEKLLHIEEALHDSVVGQGEAVAAVSNAIRRNRMGLSDPGKPIGTFLFLGSTGVGKTELCKALAEYLFNSREMLVRIDMSEYQQEHSVSRLFGAPPGYVGYGEGGQLTEAVRRKPYSVVLFDEIEKAHPKVFETLLQVLDDGRMTDGQGRVVDFKNTIIAMTSNMGQEVIMNHLIHGPNDPGLVDMVKDQVLVKIKQRVAPEFINRIDDIIMFLPLSKDDISQIVRIQLEALVKKLRMNEIEIIYDDEAVRFITDKGYRPEYGGRPVKRAIKEHIIDALSLALLRQEVTKELPIRISADAGRLIMANN